MRVFSPRGGIFRLLTPMESPVAPAAKLRELSGSRLSYLWVRMNYDEFAFFNQQLAGMLKSGIPLEGGLRQLASGMRKGRFRAELDLLERDLAGGMPLDQAVAGRKLPALYAGMLRVGSRGGNLPEVLGLVADYYARLHALRSRLKGLMVYPILVLFVALGLSLVLAGVFHAYVTELFHDLGWPPNYMATVVPSLWFPVIFLAVLLGGFVCGAAIPALRRRLRWSLPGFKEASLSQTAYSLAMLLRNGTDLDRALDLVGEVEKDTPASREIALWRNLSREGHAKFTDLATGRGVFPPLFVWLVAQGGEDMALGFQRAAEIYGAKANHRIEMVLYGFLPISVLLLGLMIVGQMFPVVKTVTKLIDMF